MRLVRQRLGAVLEYGSSRRRSRSVRNRLGRARAKYQSPQAAQTRGRKCHAAQRTQRRNESSRLEQQRMGGGGGGSPAASGSGSSSEDDGDAAWKAAIDSIASVGFGVPSSNGVAKAASGGSGEADTDAELEQPHEGKPQAPRLKLYQIKVTFVCFYAKFANPVFRLFRGGIESCTIFEARSMFWANANAFSRLFDRLNGDVCCYVRGKSTSHELEASVYTRKKHILLVYTRVAPHFLFMIVAPRQMICFFLV